MPEPTPPKLQHSDPFDLSARELTIGELGIPTAKIVTELEAKAHALYQTAKNREAAEALELFGKQANWLSNIIASGIEPYYTASYDERENYPRSSLNELVRVEKLVNEYRQKRNRAMVLQAECLLAEDDQRRAVPLLINALELIPLGDTQSWAHARKLLYDVVGIS